MSAGQRPEVPALDHLINQVTSATYGTAPGQMELRHLEVALLLARQFDDLARQLLAEFVHRARRAGASWTEIGQVLGVTRQAAQQRYGLQ